MVRCYGFGTDADFLEERKCVMLKEVKKITSVSMLIEETKNRLERQEFTFWYRGESNGEGNRSPQPAVLRERFANHMDWVESVGDNKLVERRKQKCIYVVHRLYLT